MDEVSDNSSPAAEGREFAPIIRSTRDQKPVHYTLKIESFSFFKDVIDRSDSKPKCERYESSEFDAGGYKWKLALYPDGDKKRNGSGHISLYLVKVEKDDISSTSEVDVLFTFLVYDHCKDKYMTIQDGKVRRFDAINKEWGFPWLFSHETFNDASNGVLVDDCCVFGVDIFVMKSDGKREVFSLIKKPKDNKYTWKIENFSKLDKDYYESELFTVEGYSWKINLYPKGDSRVKAGQSLSLFLKLENHKEFPSGCQVYVEWEISIKNHFGPSFQFKYNYRFNCDACSWGHPNFISLQDLIEPSKGYIVNDVLLIEAEINAISTLKSLP